MHQKTRFWNEIRPFRVCTRKHAQNTPNTQIMHKNHENHIIWTLFTKDRQKTRFWTERRPYFVCVQGNMHKTHETLRLCTKTTQIIYKVTLFTKEHQKTRFWTEILPFRAFVQRYMQKTSQTV